MKRTVVILMICALLVFCACSRLPDTSDVANVATEVANVTTVETETRFVPGQDRLSKKEKEMIWASLFGRIYNHAGRPARMELEMDGDLIYRVKTTNTVDIDSLEGKNLVSKNVLEAFRYENEKTERLPTEKLSIWPVFPFDKSDEVRELFYRAKKSRRRGTEAAVVFSNIGFNPEKEECLVYVEYFNERTGLLKFWLHFKLFRYPLPGDPRFTGTLETRWIPADKVS